MGVWLQCWWKYRYQGTLQHHQHAQGQKIKCCYHAGVMTGKIASQPVVALWDTICFRESLRQANTNRVSEWLWRTWVWCIASNNCCSAGGFKEFSTNWQATSHHYLHFTFWCKETGIFLAHKPGLIACCHRWLYIYAAVSCMVNELVLDAWHDFTTPCSMAK